MLKYYGRWQLMPVICRLAIRYLSSGSLIGCDVGHDTRVHVEFLELDVMNSSRLGREIK